jgi:hypothetical protein
MQTQEVSPVAHQVARAEFAQQELDAREARGAFVHGARDVLVWYRRPVGQEYEYVPGVFKKAMPEAYYEQKDHEAAEVRRHAYREGAAQALRDAERYDLLAAELEPEIGDAETAARFTTDVEMAAEASARDNVRRRLGDLLRRRDMLISSAAENRCSAAEQKRLAKAVKVERVTPRPLMLMSRQIAERLIAEDKHADRVTGWILTEDDGTFPVTGCSASSLGWV